jgi:hypothetical protein
VSDNVEKRFKTGDDDDDDDDASVHRVLAHLIQMYDSFRRTLFLTAR